MERWAGWRGFSVGAVGATLLALVCWIAALMVLHGALGFTALPNGLDDVVGLVMILGLLALPLPLALSVLDAVVTVRAAPQSERRPTGTAYGLGCGALSGVLLGCLVSWLAVDAYYGWCDNDALAVQYAQSGALEGEVFRDEASSDRNWMVADGCCTGALLALAAGLGGGSAAVWRRRRASSSG